MVTLVTAPGYVNRHMFELHADTRLGNWRLISLHSLCKLIGQMSMFHIRAYTYVRRFEDFSGYVFYRRVFN